MSSKDNLREASVSQDMVHPSEAEISQLLQETTKQYEETMRIADLADISDQGDLSHPRYAWDNPIGFVVTVSSNAKLG